MDEFAFGVSTEYSAYKITSNPINLDRVPGGSSGGSAAAVAGNMAPWSIGSDTGGSVSRYGITSFGSSLDQAGTITRTVEDAAKLLNIISGKKYYMENRKIIRRYGFNMCKS